MNIPDVKIARNTVPTVRDVRLWANENKKKVRTSPIQQAMYRHFLGYLNRLLRIVESPRKPIGSRERAFTAQKIVTKFELESCKFLVVTIGPIRDMK